MLRRCRGRIAFFQCGKTFAHFSISVEPPNPSAGDEVRGRASFAAHRSGGGEIERLRLGFLSSLLGPDLIQVLRSFRDERPTCQVELLDLPAADQLWRIENGTLDGGLIGGAPAKHSSDLKF